jgi:hypothetical protein
MTECRLDAGLVQSVPDSIVCPHSSLKAGFKGGAALYLFRRIYNAHHITGRPAESFLRYFLYIQILRCILAEERHYILNEMPAYYRLANVAGFTKKPEQLARSGGMKLKRYHADSFRLEYRGGWSC